MKPVRRQSNETSSRSTVPIAISESNGEGNGEITPISMDWARTIELEAPETVQSRSNTNSSTETQLSTLANSIPAMQNSHSVSESSLNSVPYSDQVLREPKPEKRHRKGKTEKSA